MSRLAALPIALLPLVIVPFALFPFVTGKAALLVLTAQLVFAAALRVRPLRDLVPRTAIGAGLLVVALASLAAAVVGRGFIVSVADTPQRQLGLLVLAHAGLLYVALRGLAPTERVWTTWLSTALVGIIVVCAIAVAQALDGSLLPAARQGERVGATLGHATHLAGLALVGGTLCAVLWSRVLPRTRWLLAAAGTLIAVTLVLADTRGAMLGLLVALGVTPLLVAAAALEPAGRRRALAGAALSLVGTVVVVALALAGWLTRVPGLGRFGDASAALGSGQARLLVWRAGLLAVRDAPGLGAGPSHFGPAIEAHHPAALLAHGWAETWFDHAHNVFINMAVEQGLVGLLAHLALLGSVAWTLWRSATRGARWESIALAAGGIALAVHRSLAFDDHASLAMVALLVAFADRPVAVPPNEAARRVSLRALALVLPLLGAAAWIPQLLSLSHAHRHAEATLRGATRLAEKELGDAMACFPPFARTLGLAATTLAFENMEALAERAGEGALREHLLSVDGHLARGLEDEPDDLRSRLARAQVLGALGRRFGDPAHLAAATAEARHAVALSPERREATYLLASLLLDRGEPAEALALLRKSVEGLPAYGGGWWRLALAHEKLGHQAEARRLARAALERGVVLDARGEAVLRRLAALD